MSSILMTKIEEALQKIDEIASTEREVEINHQKVVLGIVTGVEEEKIQNFLAEKAKENKLTFIRVMKVENLVYAIKAINAERIDKTEFFSVSNSQSDKKELVERQIFLRNKLMSWPIFIINYLFNQYLILIDESSKTFKPEFKIEGVDDLFKLEFNAQEETLKKAQESIDQGEGEGEKPMTFREIPNSETGGILDQEGH